MKKFKIGGVLESSVLAQGCMRQWKSPFEDAERVISTALECGITFFDHADVYGFGKSEECFGKYLKSGRVCVQRDERAEFCQALDSSFNNFSNLQLHLFAPIPRFLLIADVLKDDLAL